MWVTSRLSSFVGNGVLGSVTGDTYLSCMVCKLSKQLQFPYDSVSTRPFDLILWCMGSDSLRFERGSSLLRDLH